MHLATSVIIHVSCFITIKIHNKEYSLTDPKTVFAATRIRMRKIQYFKRASQWHGGGPYYR